MGIQYLTPLTTFWLLINLLALSFVLVLLYFHLRAMFLIFKAKSNGVKRFVVLEDIRRDIIRALIHTDFLIVGFVFGFSPPGRSGPILIPSLLIVVILQTLQAVLDVFGRQRLFRLMEYRIHHTDEQS